MEKKTFWIINQYASTPQTSMGGRHYYIAQELIKKGYKVYIIAGSYSHLLQNPKDFDTDILIENIEPNFDFVWIKLPKYSHAHSKKRIINEFIFAKKIATLGKPELKNPDVILYSSPALIGYLGTKLLKLKYKVPLIFEIRDPWPLTLIEMGGYSKNHPFIKFLQWIEDNAYQEANFAFSNFFNAIEHMQSRGLNPKKFAWIPNGIFLPELQNPELLPDEVLNQFPKGKFVIGYTGTLGLANAMCYLIEAAKILAEYPDIHFVIIGSGREKLNLINQAKDLTNVTFIDPILKAQVQSALEEFNVCYIGWQKNKMYRLGVAANKLPEYLYSGKPILHSYSGAGDFVRQANAGLTVEAEDPQAIADAILKLYHLGPETLIQYGENGRKFVLDNLTYYQIADKLIAKIFPEKD